jgi:hypothetical protein
MDHPATDSTPFGRVVKNKSLYGGGWVSWAIATEDIMVIERRLDRKAVKGVRKKPNGNELTWKQIGILATLEDAQLPFFVEWDSNNHPSSDGSPVAKISKIELVGEEKSVSDWINAPIDSVFAGIQMEWKTAAQTDSEKGLLSVEFIIQNKKILII